MGLGIPASFSAPWGWPVTALNLGFPWSGSQPWPMYVRLSASPGAAHRFFAGVSWHRRQRRESQRREQGTVEGGGFQAHEVFSSPTPHVRLCSSLFSLPPSPPPLVSVFFCKMGTVEPRALAETLSDLPSCAAPTSLTLLNVLLEPVFPLL